MSVAAMGVAAILCAAATTTYAQRGDWSLTGGDPGQSGWQKDEQGLSPDSIAANFKYLWKIKLGAPAKGAHTFSEPLLAGRLINGQGFKDLAYWSSNNTLYAVDSELGDLVWKKQFTAGKASGPCSVSSLGVTMEPPIVINFNARRKPGTPRPPEQPAAKSNERKLGVAPGGGYFGLKGIYVLTPDGMMHEQVMTTGADFASPVKFLPAANGGASGISFVDKAIYATTQHDCAGVANGLWAIDFAPGTYPVTSYETAKIQPLSPSGPALLSDGTAILVTGPGSAAENVYPSSVIAVGKDMKVKDWYTPEGGMAHYANVSPIAFSYKEKQLVVAPGKDGSIALLDASSLGGSDHHTPLAQSDPLAKSGEKHSWDGFAAWEDKSGTAWIYASVSAGITLQGNGITTTGSATHGAIVAFKVTDADGKLSLTPVWISEDMINPAPPRIANGVVVALASGNSKSHAVLHVLNAATGANLYSSKDEIPTYTELSGVSIGDSHAFFTDHLNTLYSFGIGLEH
jgi:outer membrane protein assembly factor BamB